MRTIAQVAAATVLALCWGAVPVHAQDMPGGVSSWLDEVAGKTLIAIDGSSVTLAPKEGTLTREIAAPNGSVQKLAFTFISDRLGTVADARDSATVIGFFRDTKDGLDAQFADGHNENLTVNPEGGLSMVLRAPDGSMSCMAWYPAGHVFNRADRQAALAEYAKRLGVALPDAETTDGAPDSGCAADPAAHEATNRAAPRLSSKPARNRGVANDPVKTAMPPAPESVLVPTSAVHRVDGDSAAEEGAAADDESGTVSSGPGASSCLSVDSDGHNWGFRNRCGYAVQFAYCLKDGGNPLTTCESGTMPGSVAANGFAALLADKTLSETDAEHSFRWVACGGGAGEVVAQLERTSPPSGRCIRANAS